MMKLAKCVFLIVFFIIGMGAGAVLYMTLQIKDTEPPEMENGGFFESKPYSNEYVLRSDVVWITDKGNQYREYHLKREISKQFTEEIKTLDGVEDCYKSERYKMIVKKGRLFLWSEMVDLDRLVLEFVLNEWKEQTGIGRREDEPESEGSSDDGPENAIRQLDSSDSAYVFGADAWSKYSSRFWLRC